LNRNLYRNTKKSNNKGCISGILGTLVVVAGIIAYAIIASLVNRLVIGWRLGNSVACALMTNTFTGMTVAFILYEAIFIVWQVKLSKAAAGVPDEKGTMAKIFRWVFIGCVSLSLILSFVFANTYTELREDSIAKVTFVTTKEYNWEEDNVVSRYTFACDAEGGLTFKVSMKDGETIDILGVVSSLTPEFKEKYNTDKVNLMAYAAHLSEEFDTSEFIIEKRVNGIEYMEKHYKESSPELWEQIYRIIKSEINE